MTIRLLMIWAALVAVTPSICDANGQQPTAVAPPDTGISCPVGFVRVMQMHAWVISPTASKELFRDSTARTLPSGWRAFRGPKLRRHLAKLASVGVVEVKGGWATQVFFGEHRFGKSFLDSTGNGLAVLIRDTGAGLVGSACLVADSAVAGGVGTLQVLEGRSMVIGVSLGGIPHALALRVATVPSKMRRKEAQSFREGVMSVATPPTQLLFPTKLTASIDSCLKKPISRAGSAAAR